MTETPIGYITNIPVTAPVPPGYVEINTPARIGIVAPPGVTMLREIMYVGAAYEAVASALGLERQAQREACARLIHSLPPGFGDLNRNDVAERILNCT